MKKGFTLLEILLVIGLIGILASVVIIAINPNQQLGGARDVTRRNDVNNLLEALQQYKIINRTEADTGVITNEYQDICREGEVDPSCISLDFLIPDAILDIPIDPRSESEFSTGYQVALNSANNTFSLRAPLVEQESSIVLNPILN